MGAKHYDHQLRMANQVVIPFLKKEIGLSSNMNVLEVGSAESGLIKALLDDGISCKGIELVQGRIDMAKKFNPNIDVIQGDITDASLIDQIGESFDLIIIRDVIEHIPNQEKALEVMNQLLKPEGYMYITFPPLYSPYAGHQQNLRGIISKMLWVHLLPDSLIQKIGDLSKARPKDIKDVIHLSKIGLSISRFKKLYKAAGFTAFKKDLYLSRPVYKIRWNWPIIKLPPIPLIQELLVTGCEYILKKA